MSWLSDLFGKSKKSQVNLNIPDTERTPTISQLQFSKPLRELGLSAIQGFGSPLTPQSLDQFGLGKDFASKALSPVAAQSRLRFKTQTAPGISSAASARGLGRSTIPVRQIAQADVERGAGLDVLLSQLETLNRQATRGAQRFGVGVSQQQQGLEAGLQQARSAEQERLINRQLGVAGTEDEARKKQQAAAILAGTAALGGGIGALGAGAAGAGGMFAGGVGAGSAAGMSGLTSLGALPVGTAAAAQGGGLGAILTGALGGAAKGLGAGFAGSNILGQVDSSQVGSLSDAQLLALWRASQGVQ